MRFYRGGNIASIVQRRVGSGCLARQRKMTIGFYPQTNRAHARKALIDAIAKLQHGTDIIKERAEALQQEKSARDAEMTVGELADHWFRTNALSALAEDVSRTKKERSVR